MMNISVIIPVYNAEKYITKSVESALQFNEVKEVILIEDGSPDNVLEICKSISQKEPRVRLYRHPNGENRGAGASRNLGIEKATQEYIAFLDADDFYLPNRFKKDKIVFKNNPDADAVYNALGVHYYSEKAKNKFIKEFNISNQNLDIQLTTVNPNINPTPENCFYGLIGLIKNYGYFSLDTLTIRKKALSKINKYFWNSSMHEDTDFSIRLAYYCKLYPCELNNAVAKRGVHEENRITNNTNKYKNLFKFYSQLYNWYSNVEKQDKSITNLLIFNILYNQLYLKKRKSIFNGLLYGFKYKNIFFNEYKFGRIIQVSSNNKLLKTIILVLHRFVISLVSKVK